MFRLLIVKRYNLPAYSFLVGLQVQTDRADPSIFVVRYVSALTSSSSSGSSLGPVPSSSSSSGESSSSSGASESSSSSSILSSLSSSGSSHSSHSSASGFPDLFLSNTSLELVSVASLGDLLFLPDTPTRSGLYRTSTITLAFKTQAQMDLTLKKIVEDVRINALFQRIPFVEFEVLNFEQNFVDDPDPDAPFIF